MSLISTAVDRAHFVLVVVALICLTGLLSLWSLSAQLLPDAENSSLNISAHWGTAAPEEMETLIAEPLTTALKGLNGLKNTFANLNTGDVDISLNFSPGTDMKETRLEVVNRLSQVTGLPQDMTGPFVWQWNKNSTLINLFLKKTDGTGFNDNDRDIIDTRIQMAFQAIPGISKIRVSGLPEKQLEVRFDAAKLAMYSITIDDLKQRALPGSDSTAGMVEIGRRTYKLRYAGGYNLQQLAERMIAWRDGRPIKLGDVAEIVEVDKPLKQYTLQNGNPAVGVRLFRTSDANVLSTHAKVKEVMAELNRQWLEPNNLLISPSYDPSVFIKRALWMVGGSLTVGMLLAIFGLWLFIHQWRPTLLIAVSIPLSLFVSVIVLKLTGRTLNVISLAGLAFTVGMVMDAAIVVLESILHQRDRGEKNIKKASILGTQRIWAALLTSTTTTVIVFLPVLWLEGAEGELFADLALTIAAGVSASLLVAIFVLPALASRYLGQQQKSLKTNNLRQKFARLVMTLTDTPVRRWLIVLIFLAMPVLVSQLTLPKVDYLPSIKAETVAASFRTTSGISASALWTEMRPKITERLAPYLAGTKEPKIKNYYFFVGGGESMLGVRALDPEKIPLLKEKIEEEFSINFPDAKPVVFQMDLMNDNIGGSRGVGIVLQSADLQAIYTAAEKAKPIIADAFGGAKVFTYPSTSLTALEIRVHPDDRRLAEVGWNRENLIQVISAFGSGQYLGDYYNGNKSLPVVLKSQTSPRPELLELQPLTTPSGHVIPLGELTSLEILLGPNQITQSDGRRSISLRVVLPKEISLQEAVERIEQKLFPEIKKLLPADGRIVLNSQASDLNQSLQNLGMILAFGLLILFVLLLGLFRSLSDAISIMLTLPLASLGGVMAIQLLSTVTEKNVDLLALIGFVILLGLVVNNAILLVYEARRSQQTGFPVYEAVSHAIESRLRPILMTTLTSIAGMLPLLLSPGAGAEIYRGLSAVIVGGMSFSAVFTLILLPALLRMGKEKIFIQEEQSIIEISS